MPTSGQRVSHSHSIVDASSGFGEWEDPNSWSFSVLGLKKEGTNQPFAVFLDDFLSYRVLVSSAAVKTLARTALERHCVILQYCG